MQWQRSEDLPKPHPKPKSIPDSDAVRLAALQASWSRDRRVAQRRIAWRWITWYAQRYAPHVLAGLMVLTGFAHYSGVRPPWSSLAHDAEQQSSVVAPSPRYTPPSVPTLTVPAEVPDVQPEVTSFDTDTPLVLRNSLTLEPRTARPAAVAEASADTLSLKPENWLHSKEP